jgi:hypothetical protein
MSATTTLVVHLDLDALDRLHADGCIEVEVYDTEQPGQMPVGTMLVTADIRDPWQVRDAGRTDATERAQMAGGGA